MRIMRKEQRKMMDVPILLQQRQALEPNEIRVRMSTVDLLSQGDRASAGACTRISPARATK